VDSSTVKTPPTGSPAGEAPTGRQDLRIRMTPLEIVQRFIDRINARDVPGLTALMTPDHRFIDSAGSLLMGRDSVQQGWRQYFRMVPDYHIEISRSFTDGDDVALFGTAGGTYRPDGHVRPSQAWATPAAWRAVVRGDAVAEWQVYADNEPIRRLMEHTVVP